MVKEFQNWFFQRVHGNSLVYNTCWEDPRCDRELLALDQESEVVMITSAGCNALAYLLDDPARVHCIDMNFRQGALLELKKAFFKTGDYQAMYDCFGTGKWANIKAYYQQQLRPTLPVFAQNYWDKNINYFSGKGLRKSFYFHGASGSLAFLIRNYLRGRKKLNRGINQLFNASSLEQQAALYREIDQRVWSRFMEWVIGRHAVMSLAGVPKSQQQLFTARFENGAAGFVQDCMNQVFTQVPVQDNYFWQVYYNGHYTKDCCPDYLREENFTALQQRVDQVATHTTTISAFLRDNPGTYSHFVLLDHQDWLAENDTAALREEWELILNNSKKGTRILLRSAAEVVDFFPDFVLDRVTFQHELTNRIHQKDRVGTYASTYLAIVN